MKYRNYIPSDAKGMSELQGRCLAVCDDTGRIHPGFYSSPGFDEGKNIFIAEDENRRMAGYAILYPQYHSPRLDAWVFWSDARVEPELPEKIEVKDHLLALLDARAKEIRPRFTEGRAVCSSTFFDSGKESIDYLCSRGFQHYETVYMMHRDLAEELPELSAPEGLQVRAWRMEQESEQKAYLQAYQEAFEFCDWTLETLQHFMTSPLWQDGTSFAAFDGERLVGSVLVYYQPGAEQNPNLTGSTEHIFVAPGYRGRGLARCLVIQGLKYLRERGMKTAVLEVVGDNVGALKAYQSCGYKIVREELSFCRDVE